MSRETYTARIMQQKAVRTSGTVTFDSKDEAIRFAKLRRWDEVVNDSNGERVWRLPLAEKRERNALVSHGVRKMQKRLMNNGGNENGTR